MRVTGLFLGLCLLAGCASEPLLSSAMRPAPEPLPPLPAVAPEDMFATAIEEVCFAAVAGNQTPLSLVDGAGFTEFQMINSAYQSRPGDMLYSAADVTSPVLLSLAPHEPRCDVVAVSGDPAELKARAEAVMLAYDDTRPEGSPHYIAFAETAAKGDFALKFSLMFGELVGEDDVMKDYGHSLPVLTSGGAAAVEGDIYVD